MQRPTPEDLLLNETEPSRPPEDFLFAEIEPTPPPEGFLLKESKPRLGAVKVSADKHTSTYDLVEETQYIYVQMVKAKDLPMKDAIGCHVEIIFGKDKGRTRPLEEESNCEWNQVFAFPRYRSQSKVLAFIVRREDDIGDLLVDICSIPLRTRADGPPAPKLYPLTGRQLRMAIWKDTGAGDNQHTYVRIFKATDSPAKDAKGCYVEIEFGDHGGISPVDKKELSSEWNQVFAFPKSQIHGKLPVAVIVRLKDDTNDDLYFGRYDFPNEDIPELTSRERPPAPELYPLTRGQLMMAVWKGTEADEEFPKAWTADPAGVSETDDLAYVRPNEYVSPKFWYLRVNVIEAKDLLLSDKGRYTEVSVKAVLGNHNFRTGFSRSTSSDFKVDEELMFVVAEPITEPLILRVEVGDAPDTRELLGRCTIPLQDVERRQDNKPVNAKWYDLVKRIVVEGEQGKKEIKFAGRISMRICLEGSYHVLDEPAAYCSDLQPTAKQLRKTNIGVLGLGILSAHILMPMGKKDGGQGHDAYYCVAKYGQKWVKTRTIINCSTPCWNEQYTWEVFDPCTVLTIGLFDSCLLNGRIRYGRAQDISIGKVRIRLSTLETGRIYAHRYPLLVLNHNGVKKIGEIHLALRFKCSSFLRMMRTYSQPVLPKMHYLHPLTDEQLHCLRRQAVQIISMRFSLVDQPLRKDVVEYMLDVGCHSHMWSMRRSKANLFRIMVLLGGLFAGCKWLNQICHWKSPITTILIHILFTMTVMYPGFILPAIFLFLFLLGIWNYRGRQRHPPCKDVRLSHADAVLPDELDEEFDNFPTCEPPKIVRMRYDRLRSNLGRIQTVLDDLVAQVERVKCLFTWPDRRAMTLFLIFCVIAAIIFCIIPFRVVVLLTGFHFMRHPSFRLGRTSAAWNFFDRLPDYSGRSDI